MGEWRQSVATAERDMAGWVIVLAEDHLVEQARLLRSNVVDQRNNVASRHRKRAFRASRRAGRLQEAVLDVDDQQRCLGTSESKYP